MATKKASKKTAAKTAAKSTGRPEKAAPLTYAQRRKLMIDQLIEDGERIHGPGKVQRAQDANASYLLRRPTGITSLDIALAGGFPAAAPSVIVGPDGAGKDYMLWLTAAEAQRRYGEDFSMAVYFTEFKPDKHFMKAVCGLQIAYSEEEITELNTARIAAGHEELSNDELDYLRHQVGEIVTIYGVSADKGFDRIFACLESGVFQLIAVNSIGFLQTEAKEDKDSFEEHAQRSSEASLLSRALPKMAMTLNAGTEFGPNESSLILVNQVRSTEHKKPVMKGRMPQAKDEYKTASNSWALKHGKAIELFIHLGGVIYDESTKEVLGRLRTWEITKGKLGTHEGIKGQFNFFHDGGVDLEGDLLAVCQKFGIITGSGWYSFDEVDKFKFKLQGSRVIQRLREDRELFDYLRIRCMQEANVICRLK
jgi:hypothetical protein